MTLRIGTRGSALALWQANEVLRRLTNAGHQCEIVTIRTTGDKRTDVSLASIGGKGLFVKELEEALQRREIDVAVHSLKDVPSFIPPEFALAAFLERGDARDAWVQRDGRPIAEMPHGARIGTSAPRRRAQLAAMYPHLQLEEMRGNVDTRMQKVLAGEYDGAVLASAGITRLGRASEITSYFSLDEMTPAAGQGVIVVETFTDEAREIAASIDHEPTAAAALSERAVLQKFDARLDCYSPIGVHAEIGVEITIRAFYKDIHVKKIGADRNQVVHEMYEALTHGDRRPATGDRGKVFLVGGGPGDPNLLTLRAAELIASADVVAIDALISEGVRARIPEKAEVIYVGKRAGAHAVRQEEINRILVAKAREGKRVVRLKGGDPFVFGRGGEEAEEIAAAGVEFEVVPGITSAIAGPAYAGIPVTHREHAAAVMFVTGHESDDSTGTDWPALAKFNGTLVFLMGVSNLDAIVRNLRTNGMPADRPVAVISRATTSAQRTIVGALGNINASGIETPALIVIGSVVRLRDAIQWFESRPLHGKRIVVTRARAQTSELRRLLEDSGAEVIEFPTIEIAPPASFESLDRLIDRIDDYDWLIFTSTNGVASFFDRLRHHGKDARALQGRMIAAVGDTTAAELRARAIEADLIPPTFQSSALLPLLDGDQRGVRTAVIRAAKGSDELLDELRRRGGEVDLAIAYEARPVMGDRSRLQNVDFVTFTSGSTVDNFFDAIGNLDLGPARLVSIGPVTSEAIRRHNRRVDIEAERATVAALHAAILRACRNSAAG